MTRIPCRVCNKPYDGATHCSVMACTPCAMFFKRSEAWNCVPRCTNGTNACKLEKAGKITCSACRYQKCIHAGMKPIKNRRSLQRIENKQNYSNCKTEDIKLTIELPELVLETMPTLKRLCYFYALVTNNKRLHEYAMLHADGTKLIELPENRFVGRISQSISNRMMKHDIAEFFTLMNGTFPAFTTMNSCSQDKLIYLLMFPLFELSASFRSLRVFNDINCRKILCTEALYADLDDLSGFLEENLFQDPMDYQALKGYISVWWGKFLNSTYETMHRIKITDMEFLAACALTIWDDANFQHNTQLCTMAGKHRSMIYKDLDYYYKKVHNILNICPKVPDGNRRNISCTSANIVIDLIIIIIIIIIILHSRWNVLRIDNYVERIMNLKELNRIVTDNYELLSESVHFLRTFNYYNTCESLCKASTKIFTAFDTIKSE